MKSKPHPLFAGMHPSVQKLQQQAQREQREKARREYWANQNAAPGLKPLLPPTKPS